MVVLSIVAVLAVAFSTISAAPAQNAAKQALDEVNPSDDERETIKEALTAHPDLVGPLVQIGQVFTQIHGEAGVEKMLKVMKEHGDVMPAIIAMSAELVKSQGGIAKLPEHLNKVSSALSAHQDKIPEWAAAGKTHGKDDLSKVVDPQTLKQYGDVLPAVVALSEVLVNSHGHEKLSEQLKHVAAALKGHADVIPGLAAVGEGFTKAGVSAEKMAIKLGELGTAVKTYESVLPTLGALGVAMKKHHEDVTESYQELLKLL